MSALTTVTIFNVNLQQNLVFLSGILCYIADTDIGIIKSLDTLFVKYLEHMLVTCEQSCVVQINPNFKLLSKQNGSTIFLTKR